MTQYFRNFRKILNKTCFDFYENTEFGNTEFGKFGLSQGLTQYPKNTCFKSGQNGKNHIALLAYIRETFYQVTKLDQNTFLLGCLTHFRSNYIIFFSTLPTFQLKMKISLKNLEKI